MSRVTSAGDDDNTKKTPRRQGASIQSAAIPAVETIRINAIAKEKAAKKLNRGD